MIREVAFFLQGRSADPVVEDLKSIAQSPVPYKGPGMFLPGLRNPGPEGNAVAYTGNPSFLMVSGLGNS